MNLAMESQVIVGEPWGPFPHCVSGSRVSRPAFMRLVMWELEQLKRSLSLRPVVNGLPPRAVWMLSRA